MADALASLGTTPHVLSRLAQRWELSRIIFYDKTDSTQNVARALMDSGAAAWTLVVADHQAAGRGQHGRPWCSEPGASLMFSLLLRPSSIEEAALLPIRAGLAMAAALEPLLMHGLQPRLKWPNDIMVADGKVGGVLCESQLRNDDASVIVGVGLNVRRFPVDISDRLDIHPAFLEDHLHQQVDRLVLLESLMRSFRACLSNPNGLLADEELRTYARHDWLLGRRLQGPATGEAAGITHEGHLRVIVADGAVKDFVAGRVLLASADPDPESP